MGRGQGGWCGEDGGGGDIVWDIYRAKQDPCTHVRYSFPYVLCTVGQVEGEDVCGLVEVVGTAKQATRSTAAVSHANIVSSHMLADSC